MSRKEIKHGGLFGKKVPVSLYIYEDCMKSVLEAAKKSLLILFLSVSIFMLFSCSVSVKDEKKTDKSTETVVATESNIEAEVTESTDSQTILKEARTLCDAGKYTEAAELYCHLPDLTEDEKTAIQKFAVFFPAIKSGDSFNVKNINSNSSAKSAATYIEKNFKSSSSNIVKQIYYAAEAVLYTSIEVMWEPDRELVNQGIEFGRKINFSYSGPFDVEIIELAKYVTR